MENPSVRLPRRAAGHSSSAASRRQSVPQFPHRHPPGSRRIARAFRHGSLKQRRHGGRFPRGLRWTEHGTEHFRTVNRPLGRPARSAAARAAERDPNRGRLTNIAPPRRSQTWKWSWSAGGSTRRESGEISFAIDMGSSVAGTTQVAQLRHIAAPCRGSSPRPHPIPRNHPRTPTRAISGPLRVRPGSVARNSARSPQPFVLASMRPERTRPETVPHRTGRPQAVRRRDRSPDQPTATSASLRRSRRARAEGAPTRAGRPRREQPGSDRPGRARSRTGSTAPAEPGR